MKKDQYFKVLKSIKAINQLLKINGQKFKTYILARKMSFLRNNLIYIMKCKQADLH